MPTPLAFPVTAPAPRLDRFLAAAHPDVSRSRWKTLIATGAVSVNGAVNRRPDAALAPGDAVTAVLPDPVLPSDLPPLDLPLAVLYEDADLIAVDKPPGLVVHPSAGHAADTLVNALLHHCADLRGIGNLLRPGIVHRLDKDTSGVLVAAKTDTAFRSLSEQFAAHTLRKEYRALAWGVLSPPDGTVDAPLGRHPTDRLRFAVRPDGRPARTHYRTALAGPYATLLDLLIETGRTHQIRVHLASLHHGVCGDPLYGRPRAPLDSIPLLPARQMLHAARLTLLHPTTRRPLTIEAPLPPDFLQAAAALVGAPLPPLPPLPPNPLDAP